jgi:hypothetical protein
VEQKSISAAKLLRLQAFLSPDGILTDFLEAGKEGLNSDLQAVISDSDLFYEALSGLERFSIIRQHDDGRQ